MKRLAIAAVLALAVVAAVGSIAYAGQGNGAPSGPHYNLNIIGVDNPKNPPMQDTSRHTIFVPLDKPCGIGLTETPNWDGTYSTQDFQVLDGNCFDGDGITVTTSTANGDVTTTLTYKLDAGFQLPPPDPNGTGTLQYTVFVKVPTPQGSAKMQTCFQDTTGTWCNTGYQLDLSKANYPKFVNVSKNLLTVCADLNNDGKWQLEPLFSEPGATYWWEYLNNGLKLAQFRFYPNTSDNSTYGGTACTPNVK